MKTKRIIDITLLLIAFWLLPESNTDLKVVNRHECKFKLCPYKGLLNFKPGLCSCEEGSDCYYLDKIHFENPGLSYDECDSILFNIKPNDTK